MQRWPTVDHTVLDLIGLKIEPRTSHVDSHVTTRPVRNDVLINQAQQEYKETMEAATEAKLDAEKRKHQQTLRYLDNQMADMHDRLRQVSGGNIGTLDQLLLMS